MQTRKEVYEVIDGERDYQNGMFGSIDDSGVRTLDEFILYVHASSTKLSNLTISYASRRQKLEMFRKIAALCVNAMEQHGTIAR